MVIGSIFTVNRARAGVISMELAASRSLSGTGSHIPRGGDGFHPCDHRRNRPAVKQRAAEIEIQVLDEPGIVLAGGADGGPDIAAAVLAGIGAAVTRAEDHRASQAVGQTVGKA